MVLYSVSPKRKPVTHALLCSTLPTNSKLLYFMKLRWLQSMCFRVHLISFNKHCAPIFIEYIVY